MTQVDEKTDWNTALTLTVKHICNSHKPTLRPKIAKELTMPTLTKKDWQTLRKMTEMNKAQQVTAPISHGRIKVIKTNELVN